MYSELSQTSEMKLFEKVVKAEGRLLFFQKALSCVFYWVLHMPLVLQYYLSVVIFTKNFSYMIHNTCSVTPLSSHISDDFTF